MSDFPHLWRVTGVSGSAPCLRGTGILAGFVASRFAAGESIAELAEDYPHVSEAHIVDAIRLVVASTMGRQGRLEAIRRRMEALVPLETRTKQEGISR
jgi:uncharacterized protein (DUF433 family)